MLSPERNNAVIVTEHLVVCRPFGVPIQFLTQSMTTIRSELLARLDDAGVGLMPAPAADTDSSGDDYEDDEVSTEDDDDDPFDSLTLVTMQQQLKRAMELLPWYESCCELYFELLGQHGNQADSDGMRDLYYKRSTIRKEPAWAFLPTNLMLYTLSLDELPIPPGGDVSALHGGRGILTATLHVGGLEGDELEDEAKLADRFGCFGTVLATTLRRRREGDKVSWALLTFAEAIEAQRAVERVGELGIESLVVCRLDTQQALESTGAMRKVMVEQRRRAQLRVSSECDRLANPLLWLITSGAAAAHNYKFKKGGVRRLNAQMQKSSAKIMEAQMRLSGGDGAELGSQGRRARSETKAENDMKAVESAQMDMVNLSLSKDTRMDCVLSQAISILVSCFLAMFENATPGGQAIASDYYHRCLRLLERTGKFLVHVESLLSTWKNEQGMIEDLYASVFEGMNYTTLRCVDCGYAGPGTNTCTGVVRDAGGRLTVTIALTPRNFAEIPGRLRLQTEGSEVALVEVVGVLFTKGVNEQQTLAHKFGDQVPPQTRAPRAPARQVHTSM